VTLTEETLNARKIKFKDNYEPSTIVKEADEVKSLKM